jgi:hypothetical protein
MARKKTGAGCCRSRSRAKRLRSSSYDAVTRGAPASEFQPERTARQQLGTMGGGNHFCELCLDEHGDVWLVLHSGSRGAGNRIGTTYIEIAQRELQDRGVTLADRDLAYLSEHTPSFDAYVEAVGWAQEYARLNRELMLERALDALAHRNVGLPHFARGTTVVNCHHNYVARERHYGADVFVTRKGAVRAGLGELGFIPGSMGARSFVVRGLGNPASFLSCSHGAGRRLSRGEARRRLTLADLVRETQGRRVPQGRGRPRRGTVRVQGCGRRYAGAAGSGEDRAHAPPGRLHQGLTLRRGPPGPRHLAGRPRAVLWIPLFGSTPRAVVARGDRDGKARTTNSPARPRRDVRRLRAGRSRFSLLSRTTRASALLEHHSPAAGARRSSFIGGVRAVSDRA